MGASPPRYRQVPRPISGTILLVLPSGFSSIVATSPLRSAAIRLSPLVNPSCPKAAAVDISDIAATEKNACALTRVSGPGLSPGQLCTRIALPAGQTSMCLGNFHARCTNSQRPCRGKWPIHTLVHLMRRFGNAAFGLFAGSTSRNHQGTLLVSVMSCRADYWGSPKNKGLSRKPAEAFVSFTL